jgi:hypothetical protein
MALFTRLVESERAMTTPCVWHLNYRNSCQRPASLGSTCPEHLRLIRCHAGTLDCAWPGCSWRAWERRGLCSFHWKVALRLIKP